MALSVPERLRELADQLESGSGRVRWLCTVFCVESGMPTLPPGPGMIRLTRDNADPQELADAMVEASERVGRLVIPANGG